MPTEGAQNRQLAARAHDHVVDILPPPWQDVHDAPEGSQPGPHGLSGGRPAVRPGKQLLCAWDRMFIRNSAVDPAEGFLIRRGGKSFHEKESQDSQAPRPDPNEHPTYDSPCTS